jgi:branched-subunit amino acid transport protein
VTVWLVILGVAASTFLLRASFIVFADPHRFPKRFRQALAFVPPAVLAAIVAPGLLIAQGAIDLTADNPRWIAGVVAIVVGARWRNALAAIASGMVSLWLLQWVMG